MEVSSLGKISVTCVNEYRIKRKVISTWKAWAACGNPMKKKKYEWLVRIKRKVGEFGIPFFANASLWFEKDCTVVRIDQPTCFQIVLTPNLIKNCELGINEVKLNIFFNFYVSNLFSNWSTNFQIINFESNQNNLKSNIIMARCIKNTPTNVGLIWWDFLPPWCKILTYHYIT